MKWNRKGFTLIEVIVVAGIIAILAGILVPMIFSQIDESKITRAKGDIKSLSSAVLTYRKDIGGWPNTDLNDGTGTVIMYDSLYTLGSKPAVPAGFANTTQGLFSDHLSASAQQSPAYAATARFGKLWKGPYMTTFTADPWGNAYFMNVWASDSTHNVWILSAGPNGTFETQVTDTTPQADDIGETLGANAFK